MSTGNGGAAILLLSSKNDEDDSGLDQSCARFDEDVAGSGAEAAGLRFLDVGVDWSGLSGGFLLQRMVVRARETLREAGRLFFSLQASERRTDPTA